MRCFRNAFPCGTYAGLSNEILQCLDCPVCVGGYVALKIFVKTSLHGGLFSPSTVHRIMHAIVGCHKGYRSTKSQFVPIGYWNVDALEYGHISRGGSSCAGSLTGR